MPLTPTEYAAARGTSAVDRRDECASVAATPLPPPASFPCQRNSADAATLDAFAQTIADMRAAVRQQRRRDATSCRPPPRRQRRHC